MSRVIARRGREPGSGAAIYGKNRLKSRGIVISVDRPGLVTVVTYDDGTATPVCRRREECFGLSK